MVLENPTSGRPMRGRGVRRRFGRSSLSGVVCALTALVLSSCNSSVPALAGVVPAVGAENQYANVVGQIGGRYVVTTAIMSNPSTDPHTFEVNTSVAQSVADARLVVQNGVGYDTFMNQLESAAPSGSRHVIDVQTLLGLANSTKNPHLWYNPTIMLLVASQIERDLVRIQPHHAAYFVHRLSLFRASFRPLEADIRALRLKFRGVGVATTEPVADYLLNALGLDNLTPFRFQADVMNGVDPSPEDVALEQNLFLHHRVKVLCYNAQVSSSVTVAMRSLAAASGVPIVAVYETMPTPGYNYQTWMMAEVNAISAALVSKTSTTQLR